jgi:hypothetical protein
LLEVLGLGVAYAAGCRSGGPQRAAHTGEVLRWKGRMPAKPPADFSQAEGCGMVGLPEQKGFET